MSAEIADGIAAVKQHIRDLTHPDHGMDGVKAAIDFWNENPGMYEAVHQPDPITGVTIQNPGPDPQAAADKYKRKVAQAAPDWVKGMLAPKASFKTAAMAASGKWASGVQDAVQNDRFRKGMGKVDEAEAIRVATSDNGAAYVAGAAKRQDKVVRVFATLMPALGAISQQIRQMPQDTPADREQRMVENLRRMRALKDVLRA
jgi:hypothetical protein